MTIEPRRLGRLAPPAGPGESVSWNQYIRGNGRFVAARRAPKELQGAAPASLKIVDPEGMLARVQIGPCRDRIRLIRRQSLPKDLSIQDEADAIVGVQFELVEARPFDAQ